ncbi:hypothetical protein BKA83DRAFT_621910 [Pisolithus microcarpus]|nr:hypothetical protein BKA83DRAFT_621910 [Pisolithus microcarpus]
MAMDSFPTFFTVRAITFACIVLLALIWLILVSVEVFTRWSSIGQYLPIVNVSPHTHERNLPFSYRPFYRYLNFEVWLDAARLLLMFVLQTGAATAFTCWSPQIQCPNQSSSDIGCMQAPQCVHCYGILDHPRSFCYSTVSTLLSWCICSPGYPVTAESPKIVPSSARPSVLPIMDPEMGEKRYSTSPGPLDSWSEYTESFITHRPSAAAAYTSLDANRRSQCKTNQFPRSPQRHKSLPAIHRIEGGSAPQRTNDPFYSSASSATVTVPTSSPTMVESTARRLWVRGPVARHLSMMPAPRKSRFPSEARRPSVAESPTARSVLSKQVPSYLM